MGLVEDAEAAEQAASKVVADLQPTGEVETGTYVKTPTANGDVLVLTKGAPPAPAAPPAGEPV